MDIFLLNGKDPHDDENPEKTWVVVAEREVDARKLLPGNFEVYEVEARTGDLGGMPGVIGWMGEPPKTLGEPEITATQKEDKWAPKRRNKWVLRGKKKAQQERAEHVARLRALRLAKEAAEKAAAEKAAAKNKKPSRLPQAHRP